MADKAYVTKVGSFGYLRNRDAIEKGAMEGRTVPPLVDYLPAGSQVKLDPDHPATVKALASGAIEEPGQTQKQERERLEARIEQLKTEQEQLAAQVEQAEAGKDAGDGLDSLKKAELESLAEAHSVDLSAAANNAERVELLRAANLTASGPAGADQPPQP